MTLISQEVVFNIPWVIILYSTLLTIDLPFVHVLKDMSLRHPRTQTKYSVYTHPRIIEHDTLMLYHFVFIVTGVTGSEDYGIVQQKSIMLYISERNSLCIRLEFVIVTGLM